MINTRTIHPDFSAKDALYITVALVSWDCLKQAGRVLLLLHPFVALNVSFTCSVVSLHIANVSYIASGRKMRLLDSEQGMPNLKVLKCKLPKLMLIGENDPPEIIAAQRSTSWCVDYWPAAFASQCLYCPLWIETIWHLVDCAHCKGSMFGYIWSVYNITWQWH